MLGEAERHFIGLIIFLTTNFLTGENIGTIPIVMLLLELKS